MRCASCGFDLKNPAKFCPGCGKPFVEAKSHKIKIACPCCHQKISVTNKWCGRELKCPGCKHAILVPNEIPAALDVKNLKMPDVPKLRSIDDDDEPVKPKFDGKTVVVQAGNVRVDTVTVRDKRQQMLVVAIVVGSLLGIGVLVLGGFMIANLMENPDVIETTQQEIGF
ncbi:MAG: hypothetical protein IJZ19_12760 [Lentisphaeria bacterium]|nr:hypothetical protein [Lentisphaeria bacterium]MBQ8755896.1 hypothetical protein [Lentisphaeria bacterium]MBQ9775044.1 hypothetical protein [Lentisphaeria bacterium]